MPRRIHSVNRIIPAVRIHIEPDEVSIGIHVPIRIEKPPPLWVTVSTLQIVKSRLGVIVIPTIAEVVISPHDAFLHRRRIGCRAEGKIPPGVIRIRTDFLAGSVIDGYDISLQVLLKEIVLELPGRHALRPVLHPDGRAVLVVQVYKTVYAELLRHDLAPVQQVAVLLTANRLGGPDPVCIVGKPVVRLQHGL